jgi:hypothetical protein
MNTSACVESQYGEANWPDSLQTCAVTMPDGAANGFTLP